MQRYFYKKGYRCLRFDYPSRRMDVYQAAGRLNNWLAGKNIYNPDFVCHSLGGLVGHAYIETCYQGEGSPRLVCLGSPLKGSLVAGNLSRHKIGRWLLGAQSDSVLVNGIGGFSGKCLPAMIAGRHNMGVGRALGICANDAGDGTVLIEETRIDGLVDHIVLDVSHSGMVFSKKVCFQIESFLQNNQFDHHEYG